MRSGSLRSLTLTILCLLTAVCTRAQLPEPLWYELTVYETLQLEEAIRWERKSMGLQTMTAVDAQDEEQWHERYDEAGRLVYHRSWNKSSYNNIDDAGLKDKRLVNEWHFRYNKHGHLTRAIRKWDFIQGTSYGGDEPYSLPYVAGPWKLIHNSDTLSWSYAYDAQGRLKTQYGPMFHEPYRLQSTTQMIRHTSREFRYEWNETGMLISQQHFRSDVSDSIPHNVVRCAYTLEGDIATETHFAGDTEVRLVSFRYAEGQPLQERTDKRAGHSIRYTYDADLNCTQIEQLTNTGLLRHRQQFTYDEKGRVTSKKYSVMRINNSQQNVQLEYHEDKKGRIATIAAGPATYRLTYH